MNLSKLDNMFTETPFGENASESRAVSSLVDLDFRIGELSVSPVPDESTCARADESSGIMVTSDVSGSGGLLSAFDAINLAGRPFLRNNIAKSTAESGDIVSVSEANLHVHRIDEEQRSSTHDSSDSARMHGPPRHGDAETEVVDGSERTQKSNDHLIVYASSRRNNSSNISAKLNQNKDPSRNYRVIAQNDSMPDLKSLQTARRKGTLPSKSAKSSVLGLESLQDFEENNELDQCLGSGKKVGRVRGVQGKGNAIRDQTGKKSVQNSSTPTGRISLKIKIGNQLCGADNVAENIIDSRKKNSGLYELKGSKFREELPGNIILPDESKLKNQMVSDASALGTCLGATGGVENKSLRACPENRCSDPGTSPDSEVINSVPHAPLCERVRQDMQGSPVIPTEKRIQESFANSVADVSLTGVSSLKLPKLHLRKGKKTTGAVTRHKVRAPMDPGRREKKVDISLCDDALIVPPGNPFQIAYSRDGDSSGPVGCSSMTNSGDPCSTSNKVSSGSEVKLSPEFSDATEYSKSQACESLIACSNGQKFLKCSTARGGCLGRSGILDLPGKKRKAPRKKVDRNNYIVKHQIEVKDDASGALSTVETHQEAGPGQYAPPRNAWVLCDECQKWRRIPATLADQINQTNCHWTCKDNTDKDFADCSIPQEKSNSEINEELDISDASCDEDAGDTLLKSNNNKSKAAKPSSWTLIKSNLFLHRSRKTQNIDEVMVCHCKPPSDGRMGCGSKCLNRMLNIECVRGTCPCGELCSNQQFQKRIYAKLKWLRCGKKGFGLQALQDISEGQFLIEYVGEVLDIHAHEARQREYAFQGHKHFYFMTLNGSEVIDACAKGNLGRFINHSCDPNCQTEKWMVNGEVCVGLFAIRDIKKGEEVTFDYNYVRVFGAAAKKCVCGSPNCRGYIGGDPTNSEVIVQEDSDEEFAEPVMICENREMNNDWTVIMSQSLFGEQNGSRDEIEEDRNRMKNIIAGGQSESITSDTSIEKVGVNSASHGCSRAAASPRYDSSAPATLKAESEGLLSHTSSPVNRMEASFQSDETMNSTMPSALHFGSESQMSTTAVQGKLEFGTVVSEKKLKYGTIGVMEDFAKSNPLSKTRYSSPSIKKGKSKSNVVNDKGPADGDKPTAVRHKSKKLPGLPLNSHVEAVEGKLNELLDTEGGISKRKDASRGYLKLLFLTAASGTNGDGEAIQSNRDLSMILDALLKTKSRTVLVDIINKNGSQMLHNIIKRCRKEFIKTPILRKLLKVLEYLAVGEILTLEHIIGNAPRPGVESFKDSILSLTEHEDKQVHQIARNFRDKWIPKSLRKSCFRKLEDGKMEFLQHSTYGKLSALSGDHWSDRGGKHADSLQCCDKQPVVAASGVETSTLDPSSASACTDVTNKTRTRKRKSRWDTPAEECTHPKKPNVDKDTPPGFSPPCNDHIIPAAACSTAPSFHERDAFSKHPSDIVLADSQERFIARLPVSYGIPSSLLQQFAIFQAEAAPTRTLAPGLPFHPFPPLPPCVGQAVQKTGQEVAGIKRLDPPKRKMTVASEHPLSQPEGGSYSLGRKFFRQQKWNNSRLAPPWVRTKNGGGQSGSTGNGRIQVAEDMNWSQHNSL